ncbi:MAG: bifunctional phosphoribosylaminoimidazolecarboxamide formyltransferase/IMP cyclohydrolase [Chloroflexi bacterium]|nr:bifunctional phosphoribosylaminoimidazolecarboxamide formyltransferase/IMP cyclohydrolase [Chloroflexota bacterium]
MRALVSVYDKSGLVDLAHGLNKLGVELVSSGGTAAAIRQQGIPVQEVADVTGFPEMLDGRVKTLHPAIHGGILAERSKPEHLQALERHGIAPIDLVICNLYPFEAEPSIENIDIGGVTLIRAAAKNHAHVAVVTNAVDYHTILREIELKGEVSEPTRRQLAEQAFALTASYDARIAAWFNGKLFPERLTVALDKTLDLRYGENPHQQAAFYRAGQPSYPSFADMRELRGAELSFNNILDMEAAVNMASAFDEPCVALIKHNNPCGLAVRPNLLEAYKTALECDPVSAYGCVLASNRPITLELANAFSGHVIDVMVAPLYEPAALQRMEKRRSRLVELPGDWRQQPDTFTDLDFKRVRGGFLVQTPDLDSTEPELKTVTTAQPTPEQLKDLKFAWKVVRHVKSNAIILCRDRNLLGVGAGQQNRVESVGIAVTKAGDKARGSVLASDAFFPFADGMERAIEAGVAAVIQPGGSLRDEDVIAAADKAGIPMVFAGERHFKH